MDKKWTQSLTIVGGLGALIIQSLLGLDVLPAEANEAAISILENLMELARNVFVMVSIYGARRAMG